MVAAAAVSLYLQLALRWDSDRPREFAWIMIVTVAATTVVWLAVTLATKPESKATLAAFYRRVRPGGPGWAPVAAALGEPPPGSRALIDEIANAMLGCVMVYAALFGVGEMLLRSVLRGAALLLLAAGAAALIAWNLRAIPAESVVERS